MTTWEEIRDEMAEMLADGKPLEDIISKLEKIKNEMAKAELIKTIDEMKKHKPMTREYWFCSLSTEEKAMELESVIRSILVQRHPMCYMVSNHEFWENWFKQPHREENEE